MVPLSIRVLYLFGGYTLPNPPIETKPWYLSKGVIGAVIVIVATVLGIIGKPDAAEQVTAESEGIAGIISQIAALIGRALAIWGRITASTKITK